MGTPLNICLISREYIPDTAFGGIATFSRDTALMLAQRGHRVTVFSQSLSDDREFDDNGVTVVKVKVPKRLNNYRLLPPFIAAFNCVILKAIRRHHRSQPFDVIDAPDHLAEGLLASFTGIPVVTRLHTPYALIVAMGLNNYRKGPSYYFIKAAEQAALRRSRVLYAPCMDLARRSDELFGLKGVPVRVFGYPLDLQMFSPAAPGATAGKRILFLGRLEQRKGIVTMAEAFPRLLQSSPTATLTLVGNDTPNITGGTSAKAYMEAAFRKAGCLDRVRFEKPVPLEQLPRLFHTHDVVWVPSFYDNYPLVCLEAMACGKAVVVADSGGLPEMVQHEQTGLVFPAGDAGALAASTQRIFEDAGLRATLEANARAYTVQNCSWDTIYEHTIDMYRFALESGKA